MWYSRFRYLSIQAQIQLWNWEREGTLEIASHFRDEETDTARGCVICSRSQRYSVAGSESTRGLWFSSHCAICMLSSQRIKGISCFFSYTVYSYSLYYPSVEAGQSPTTQRSPPASERTPEEAAGWAGGAGATDEGAPGCQRKQAAGAGDREEGGNGRWALHFTAGASATLLRKFGFTKTRLLYFREIYLVNWVLGKCVWVRHPGFPSPEIIRISEQQGRHFIDQKRKAYL